MNALLAGGTQDGTGKGPRVGLASWDQIPHSTERGGAPFQRRKGRRGYLPCLRDWTAPRRWWGYNKRRVRVEQGFSSGLPCSFRSGTHAGLHEAGGHGASGCRSAVRERNGGEQRWGLPTERSAGFSRVCLSHVIPVRGQGEGTGAPSGCTGQGRPIILLMALSTKVGKAGPKYQAFL